MNKEQAFAIILDIRNKFIGTKQDQITVDQALKIIQDELFKKEKTSKK